MKVRIVWAVLATMLLALLAVVPFPTTDARGVVRHQPALEVWGAVAPRLADLPSELPLPLTYGVALTVTAIGMFVLLAAALGARHDGPDPGADTWSVPWELLRARARLRALSSGVDLPPHTARACAAAIAVISLAACWRLGGFVIHADGSTIPDSFASIDHPFHVARAEALRQALLGGENLRWVGNHQGGYPAEYYPFGFAYGVVTIWALLAGVVSLPVVHKLTVIAVLLAPGLIYWWMARRDGWSPVVALSAFALHLVVTGGPWHGGANELVAMGLGPNVAAAILAVVFMVLLVDALRPTNRRAMAWAALAGAAALWCNPRSGVALVAGGVGAWTALLAAAPALSVARAMTVRLVTIAGLSVLLAAPLLASLLRFGDLYHFIRYEAYASSTEYLAASIDAVSMPAMALAVVGVCSALLLYRARPVTAATALSVVVYGGATLVLSGSESASRLIPQLEATRLMPFQRFVILYLAATGLYVLVRWIATQVSDARLSEKRLNFVAIPGGLILGLAGVAFLPAPERSSAPQMESLREALHTAMDITPADTAVLVIGSALSTHQQLWAPVVGDRAFFYDNWMWYWHTRHQGPYNPGETSWYNSAKISDVFSRAYLSRHGIGAVIVTGSAQELATGVTHLIKVGDGTYTPYLVADPVPIATFGQHAPDSAIVTNHVIQVDSTSASGDLVVRRNWFPRWRAVVNGRQVQINRTDDGYMQVPVSRRGHITATIYYALDAIDVSARLAAVLGLVTVVVLHMPRRAGANGGAALRAP